MDHPANSPKAGFEGDRAGFESLVLLPIAALLLVHTAFYLVSNRRRPPAAVRPDPAAAPVSPGVPAPRQGGSEATTAVPGRPAGP